jgi:hypothetical protein
MPDCLASGHSGTGMKRSAYAGMMMIANMPMPAASASVPMPNYAKRQAV